MNTLTVNLGDRRYPIHIGPGVLGQHSHYLPHLHGSRVLVVSNEIVAPLYLDRLRTALNGVDVDSLILPDGEAQKTLESAALIYDKLLAGRYGRDSTLIALGGGVVGDLTGFAAATYQRGIDFIQVPTTLLAQVDSSVGGKTGVNHPRGKNMVGAFHQPRAVIADTDCLRTLPVRELRAGIAEIIKYGLLGDFPFFLWLESQLEALLAQDSVALAEAIQRSCANKARIVGLDERESGPRALLNLGHTFGHAIETALGYGEWLHGEAVACGLCLAADLSSRLGWLAPPDRDRVVALVARAGLPTRLPRGLGAKALRDAMGHDKKVLAGKLRLVLLKQIGEAVVTSDFDAGLLDATLEQAVAGAA